MALNRITTGISKLDDALQGGLPENSITLVSGPAGSGKTLLALQCLYTNALAKRGGAYFSFEEPIEDLKIEAAQMGMDFDKASNVEFFKMNPFDYGAVVDTFRKTLSKKKVKVAVIDSISTLASFSQKYITSLPNVLPGSSVELRPEVTLSNEAAVKAVLFDLVSIFKETGTTALWLSELPKEFLYFSRDTESEFLADGIILLNRFSTGQSATRLLTIEKMRKTKHPLTRFALDISEKGLSIRSPEKVFDEGGLR